MKKTLLLFTCLLAFIAMPVLAQQKTVKKRVTFQLIKKRGADAAVAGKRKAAAAAQAATRSARRRTRWTYGIGVNFTGYEFTG